MAHTSRATSLTKFVALRGALIGVLAFVIVEVISAFAYYLGSPYWMTGVSWGLANVILVDIPVGLRAAGAGVLGMLLVKEWTFEMNSPVARSLLIGVAEFVGVTGAVIVISLVRHGDGLLLAFETGSLSAVAMILLICRFLARKRKEIPGG
jgi:hypothetical protein